MIDSRKFVTDSQLVSAFQSGGALYAPGTPPMEALRTVAEYSVAAYVASEAHRLTPALEELTGALKLLVEALPFPAGGHK